jgi:hypothetical protein
MGVGDGAVMALFPLPQAEAKITSRTREMAGFLDIPSDSSLTARLAAGACP